MMRRQDGVQYGTKGYHPLENAFWRKGETVTCLARTFQIIEETSERLRMIKILAYYFWSVILSPDDLLASEYLSLNRLAWRRRTRASSRQSTGRSLAQILMDAQTTLDLGLVADQSKSNKMTGTDDGQDSVDVCGTVWVGGAVAAVGVDAGLCDDAAEP